jgi:hypothetical protein
LGPSDAADGLIRADVDVLGVLGQVQLGRLWNPGVILRLSTPGNVDPAGNLCFLGLRRLPFLLTYAAFLY